MTFSVKFSDSQTNLNAIFGEEEALFHGAFSEIHEVTTGVEQYAGDYTVTPNVSGKTLSTKQKFLVEDITIRPIPYYEVSNTAGGDTVFIAKEL